MRILYVMDPIEQINIKKDTTFALMLAAQERGHEVWYGSMNGLAATGRTLHVVAQRATLQRVVGAHVTLGEAESLDATVFDQIWMRKDPPFDGEYLAATWLLELAERAGVRVVNRPAGLRTANEKAYILGFEEHTPRTRIARDRASIDAFVAEQGGRAILKPLDMMGGAGIFLLREDDPNTGSIIEQSTRYGQRYVMVQEFLPAAAEGDKRILLMDGEPLGALLRVPQGREFRGNLAAGGAATAAQITEDEHRIIEALAPQLRADGLYFVGLDVIGGRITEINVTSPTGIQEMSRYDGVDYAGRVVDWMESVGRIG